MRGHKALWSAWVAAVRLLGACGDDPTPPGNADAGVMSDAGTDAGMASDAGTQMDAGTTTDAGTEWRTPPLWGLRLNATVKGHTRLLHDGRARSVLEAILWHGGEATAAREAVRRMAPAERNALLTFLDSL